MRWGLLLHTTSTGILMLKRYYDWRANKAQATMDLIRGMQNATESQLKHNIEFCKARAKRDYYRTMRKLS